MIALAFLVFLVSVVLLGWLLPRFAGLVASRLWERRLARKQRRLEREADGVEVVLYGTPYLMSHAELASRTSGSGTVTRRLRDESGAALPSTLGVLTVVAFGYIAFLAVRQILRVAGALP